MTLSALGRTCLPGTTLNGVPRLSSRSGRAPAGPRRYRGVVNGDALAIVDVLEAGRYEAHAGQVLAGFIEYRWMGGRRVLLHTEVLPGFAGRGVGSTMARHVLDEAVASHARVTVKCPFIRAYIERHQQYASISTALRPVDRSG